tara:strand:+ start:360 stop:518 length:159 start_codon:yes stop_codon:yes gene_type:complete
LALAVAVIGKLLREETYIPVHNIAGKYNALKVPPFKVKKVVQRSADIKSKTG